MLPGCVTNLPQTRVHSFADALPCSNLHPADSPKLYHNTFWGVQEVGQNAVLLNAIQRTDLPGGRSTVVGCANVDIRNNILAKSLTARMGPVLQIRADLGEWQHPPGLC
jgi:hypothetical protein